MAINQGCKGCSKRDNIRITKLMFDWMNSGHQKGKMNQEKFCPCCGDEEETLTHLFQCKAPKVVKVREESIAVMKKVLQSTNAPSQMTGPFLELVQNVSGDNDVTLTGQICPVVSEAIADQQKIGKHLMIRGFLSKNWHQAIEHHTKVRINSKSTLLVSSLWKKYFFPI